MSGAAAWEAERELLLAQEAALAWPQAFGAADALELARAVVHLAPEYGRGVGLRVWRERDGLVLLQWMMDDKDAHNLPYIKGKRLAARAAGHASLWCWAEHAATGAWENFFDEASPECPTGGAFPIRLAETGEWVATASVSGLHEGADHELIVRALCELRGLVYGVDVPVYEGTLA